MFHLKEDHGVGNDQNDSRKGNANGHEKNFRWFSIFIFDDCARLGELFQPMSAPDPGEWWTDNQDRDDPTDCDVKFRTSPRENSFTFVGEVDQTPSDEWNIIRAGITNRNTVAHKGTAMRC